MRPQDIVILLKKITQSGREMNNAQLANSLGISASEVSEALERCKESQLIDPDKKRVNILALKEFLVHGLKYAFPAVPKTKVRGTATAVSAPPLKDKITNGQTVYVWPYAKGDTRGEAITPLYRTIPVAVTQDATLYALLAIADTFRIGRSREVNIAKTELDSILSTYDVQ